MSTKRIIIAALAAAAFAGASDIAIGQQPGHGMHGHGGHGPGMHGHGMHGQGGHGHGMHGQGAQGGGQAQGHQGHGASGSTVQGHGGQGAQPQGSTDHQHGSSGSAATGRRADSPVVAAFRAANDRMHRDMDIAFTGNADIDFVRGMIPHHQGAIDMARIVLG